MPRNGSVNDSDDKCTLCVAGGINYCNATWSTRLRTESHGCGLQVIIKKKIKPGFDLYGKLAMQCSEDGYNGSKTVAQQCGHARIQSQQPNTAAGSYEATLPQSAGRGPRCKHDPDTCSFPCSCSSLP